MDKRKLFNVLLQSKKYIEIAYNEAEAKHDDPEGQYYMDSVQYEIMQETKSLLKDIEEQIKLFPSF